MNITEIIAQAIQEMLDEHDGTARINRNEFAGKIGCVPSQINYVLSSRFTPEHGYLIESRRGGGGYIRITRIQLDRSSAIMHIVNSIGDAIDPMAARVVIENSAHAGILKEEAARLMTAAVSATVMREVPPDRKDRVRAAILKQMYLKLL